jgi:hypothetical protein
MVRISRVVALAALVAALAASRALADGHPVPRPEVTPVPTQPADPGRRFTLDSWRSARIGGVLWERVRFTFCTSLTPGPFAVSVAESRGWSRDASPRKSDIPRFVQRGRFALRLDARYPVDVPQCRRLGYSWRPKRVMLLPGVRALDLTVAYPLSTSPDWPIVLTDHEVAIR